MSRHVNNDDFALIRIGLGLLIALTSHTAGAEPTTGGAGFPRALTTSEIAEHLNANSPLHAVSGSNTFTLTVKGKSTERHCAHCKTKTDTGSIRYKEDQNQVCLRWEKVNYPEPTCYSLLQTGDTTFEMRSVTSKTLITYNTSGEPVRGGSHGKKSSANTGSREPAQGMSLGQKIVFSIDHPTTDNQQLLSAGTRALQARGWTAETCEKDCLRGSLSKDGVRHWVEIRTKAPYVEIGFIAGTQQGKSGWLDNLKDDMQAFLKR